MQGDLLALTQHVYSQGVTSYSIPYGTVIILVLCFIIQAGIRRFAHFPTHLYSLSFLPSALFLGLLTNLLFFSWAFLIFCIITLLIFAGWVILRRNAKKSPEKPLVRSLTDNLLILTLICGTTGFLSNTDDTLHYELQMQHLLIEGDYEGVLKVAEKFHETTPRMTAFRAIALQQTHDLGNKLFEYPLCGRADELLIPADDSVSMLCNPLSMTAALDSLPYTAGTKARAYLQNSLARDTCRIDSLNVRDYWLCALLLDKQLDRFAEELPKYYRCNASEPDSLPKHYREALVLYTHQRLHPTLVWSEDKVMNTNYEDFSQIQKKQNDPVMANNMTRNSFGHTYWWYFFYK